VIETALVAMIKSLPAVGSRNCAVYHDTAPQNAVAPYIVYSLTSRRRIRELTGSRGLAAPVFGLEVFAQDTVSIRAITRALLDMQGSAVLASMQAIATGVGETLKWLWVNDETDRFQAPTQAQEKGNKYAVVEVTVWHVEN
jgi:hypothetical protein